MEVLIVVTAIALGLTTGAIAQSKGYSFVGYFILGSLLPIIGVLLAIGLHPNTTAIERQQLASGGSRRCPFCAEVIRAEAKVCRYCGRELPAMSALEIEKYCAVTRRNVSPPCAKDNHARCQGLTFRGADCACSCHSWQVNKEA